LSDNQALGSASNRVLRVMLQYAMERRTMVGREAGVSGGCGAAKGDPAHEVVQLARA